MTRLRDTTPAVSRLGTDQGGEKNNGSRTEIDRSIVINTRGQDEWFGFTNSMNMRCGAEVNGLVVVVVHFHFCVVVLLGLSSSPPHAPPKVGRLDLATTRPGAQLQGNASEPPFALRCEVIAHILPILPVFPISRLPSCIFAPTQQLGMGHELMNSARTHGGKRGRKKNKGGALGKKKR